MGIFSMNLSKSSKTFHGEDFEIIDTKDSDTYFVDSLGKTFEIFNESFNKSAWQDLYYFFLFSIHCKIRTLTKMQPKSHPFFYLIG